MDRARPAGRAAGGWGSPCPPDLVERHYAEVYRYAFSVLRDERAAEDAVQDAFVRALGALGGYPEERLRAMRLRPWMYRITLNVARNRLRQRRELPVEGDFAGGGAESGGDRDGAMGVLAGATDFFFGVDSPIGTVYVAAGPHGVRHLVPAASEEEFARRYRERFGRFVAAMARAEDLAERVTAALTGEGAEVPLDLSRATPFQRRVLETVKGIPRGEVRPYVWVAREAGSPDASRAVGNVMASNPVPLIVPCHRVVRNDGRTGSYAFGAGQKVRLLKLDGVPPLAMAIGQQAGAAFLLLPLAAISLPEEAPPLPAALCALALTVLSTALAYLLYFRLIENVGPTKTLTVTFLIPVFGLLFGVLLLGEPIGVGTLVGFGIILYSVALVTEIRLGGAKGEDHPPSRG